MNTTPVLSVKNVTRVFGQGRGAVRAVNNVSLEVSQGEVVLLMGPSGSGKTTLLSIAGGILSSSEGTVVVAGRDLTALDERGRAHERLRSVGFVFQSFNLLEQLTAQENVEIALNIAGTRGRRAQDRAEALLKQVGLDERLDARTRDLSGGEKQRVSIARALANEPVLVLADEPTANLDSRRGHEVMLLLRDLAHESNRAVVVVSHDQRLREIADRVLWMEDGQFAEAAPASSDPVCGTSMPDDSPVTVERNGDVFRFCSSSCRDLFESDPSRYVASSK